MIKKRVHYFILLGMFLVVFPVFSELPSHPLIEKANQKRAPRVRYALENGAEVGLTSDGKSYYLSWFPKGTDLQKLPPVIATMGGHDGWAFDDFYVWHRFLKERGYGFFAIQWWLGGGEEINDYLLPHEIYRVIDEVFRKLHVKPGAAMLHGFSRGSANIYAVAALDRSLKNNYFSLFIANAGKAYSDYPPTREIEKGRFGDKPFAGSHWITFAVATDNPDRGDSIQSMRETGEWIRRNGGTVELAIEDPNDDHGGFHRHPKNTNAALDVFDKLLRKNE